MLGFSLNLLAAVPAVGAERVSFSYGPLEFSISTSSLETYAQTGKLDSELALYAQYLKPDELAQLRQALRDRVDLNPVTISQFLYSAFGETSLQYLGELIQTDTRINGFYALRAALVLAAADSKGLTLLNVIKKFPTSTIRINSTLALEVAQVFTQVFDLTNRATALVEQQAQNEVITDPQVNAVQPLNLQQSGPLKWQKEILNLRDQRRARALVVDLYQPQQQTPAPVLVISHGLASDRINFAFLAEHLASHGFAVAAIEHPGSNRQLLQKLLRGTAKEVVEPHEFIDRPLDISYLLDELSRRSQPRASLQGRLNLEQVGVIGHSFGGYTALALAGAKSNVAELQEECRADLINLNAANLSLLLQCLARNVSPKLNQPFQDSRIRAVAAINPMINGIFGQKGLSHIQVPVLLVAGSNDPITPALLEQICPFTWLTMSDKYLALIEQGTHMYLNLDSSLQIPPELMPPNPVLARDYVKAMSLAFAKRHVAAESEYRSYLTASYSRSISQPPMPLKVVRSLTAEQLSQTLNLTCPGAQTSSTAKDSDKLVRQGGS